VPSISLIAPTFLMKSQDGRICGQVHGLYYQCSDNELGELASMPPSHLPQIPTVSAYKAAFSSIRNQLSAAQMAMLSAQYLMPDHTVTATQLALAAGYANYRAANLHLKTLCKEHNPPLPFGPKESISKLNEALRQAEVYDTVQWRTISPLADIRNRCDHADMEMPRKEDVEAMIQKVRQFIAAHPVS
jgi:hypothetical protein